MEPRRDHPVKNGFDTLAMQALYACAYPFFHCTCKVPEEIQAIHQPVIFCCNHYEYFGPLAVAVSLSLPWRMWVNAPVLEARKHVDEMVGSVQKTLPFLSEDQAKTWYLRLCTPAEYAFAHLPMIPVYREGGLQMMTTMNLSAEAMARGENIVIFPETGLPSYPDGEVSVFFQGFAMLGAFYRRQTGKDAIFCPLYVDRFHRKMLFGTPVMFGQGNPGVESQRIAEECHKQLCDFANQCVPMKKTVDQRLSA